MCWLAQFSCTCSKCWSRSLGYKVDSILGTSRDAVKIPRVPGRETAHMSLQELFAFAVCLQKLLLVLLFCQMPPCSPWSPPPPSPSWYPERPVRVEPQAWLFGSYLVFPLWTPLLGESSQTCFGGFWEAYAPFWATLVTQMVKYLPECRRPGSDPWIGKIPWRRK